MKTSSYLFVALSFGLAWALRGHFGHEHGAAWAGAIASLAVILAAGRTDWFRSATILASLSGLGWAVGGMMSYGVIVGYGRGTDFLNVYYGLAMLSVVGGLYGFLGGGFLGLSLEADPEKPSQWPALLTEMVAGGLLLWSILIAQMGWRMTPPRSELWAACLGASLALAWHLQRNAFHRSLRLAGLSALGTGFGFAFGNFLQTLGSASGVPFNWWNVMEFTLGFFGGLGVAHGVFSRPWPELRTRSGLAPKLGFLLLFLVIPAVNVMQAFERDRMAGQARELGLPVLSFLAGQRLQAWFLVALIVTIAFFLWRRISTHKSMASGAVGGLFAAYLLAFVLLSHVRKAVLWTGLGAQLEQAFYWPVLACLLLLWLNLRPGCPPGLPDGTGPVGRMSWSRSVIALLSILAFLAFLLILSHEGLPGAQKRF